MRSFEERFRKMTGSGASPEDSGFTPELVQGYILAGAEHDAMHLSAAAVLRAFAREWWEPAIEEVLYGERRPGSWVAVDRFVLALLEVDPQRFVEAPRELIARVNGEDVLLFLHDHRDAVVPALRAVVADESDHLRWKCATYLLEIDRSSEPWVEEALRHADAEEVTHAAWELKYAGYGVHDRSLRRLFAETSYRLSFPAGYLARPELTAGPDEAVVSHAFGGRVAAPERRREHACLYHVLTLDPVPLDIGVSLTRLTLAVDLDDLVYEGTPHFYRHGDDGLVEPLDPASGTAMRPGPAESPAIVPTRVALVRETEREQLDRWGRARRFFRLGGRAAFVQDSVYPECPLCLGLMPHLLSLDSGLPLDGESEHGIAHLEWGSGGVANAFWCDACRVSEWEWACT